MKITIALLACLILVSGCAAIREMIVGEDAETIVEGTADAVADLGEAVEDVGASTGNPLFAGLSYLVNIGLSTTAILLRRVAAKMKKTRDATRTALKVVTGKIEVANSSQSLKSRIAGAMSSQPSEVREALSGVLTNP